MWNLLAWECFDSKQHCMKASAATKKTTMPSRCKWSTTTVTGTIDSRRTTRIRQGGDIYQQRALQQQLGTVIGNTRPCPAIQRWLQVRRSSSRRRTSLSVRLRATPSPEQWRGHTRSRGSFSTEGGTLVCNNAIPAARPPAAQAICDATARRPPAT